MGSFVCTDNDDLSLCEVLIRATGSNTTGILLGVMHPNYLPNNNRRRGVCVLSKDSHLHSRQHRRVSSPVVFVNSLLQATGVSLDLATELYDQFFHNPSYTAIRKYIFMRQFNRSRCGDIAAKGKGR